MNNTTRDILYMAVALSYAKKAKESNNVPIGAIIINQSGSIIGSGWNQVETEKNQLAHAEICAIREATKTISDWRLQDCTLYVTLEPCMMCFGLIHLSRIKRCVFAAPSPLFGAQKLFYNTQYANHICEVISGVLQNESVYLLKEFFKTKRQDSL